MTSARTAAMLKIYLRTYDTADAPIAIAGGSRSLRRKFLEVLNVADPFLDEPETEGHHDHYDRLKGEVEAIMGAKPATHWIARLNESGIPVSAVKFPVELFDDPQANANGMFHRLRHPEAGDFPRRRRLPIPGTHRTVRQRDPVDPVRTRFHRSRDRRVHRDRGDKRQPVRNSLIHAWSRPTEQCEATRGDLLTDGVRAFVASASSGRSRGRTRTPRTPQSAACTRCKRPLSRVAVPGSGGSASATAAPRSWLPTAR